MRKIHRKALLFSLILSFALPILLNSCAGNYLPAVYLAPMLRQEEAAPSMNIINPDSEVRGVWIASVFNIDYPSSNGLSGAELQAELDAILDTCKKNKLNTVFFQVRPACDALYKSEIFPISAYISKDGTLPFDPLEYLVTKAHSMNIYVHAWVNPLRVTVSGNDLSALPDGSPAKEHPDWVVPYADGKLYLNAGLAEVRQLIADGVGEIVANYDVDGVVFDDYFYPYPAYDENGSIVDFDDSEEYAFYGSMFDNIADWRRDNINQIIKLCHTTVHETDPECVFGVAPSGVWQNDNGSNGGSATRGFEAYHSLYCDALAWIDGGYIDYISPQIYWDFSSSGTPYDVVLRWWNAALDGSDVKLYVSHASYKYEDGNWEAPSGELTEQVEFARSERAYHGSVFYGYDEINRNINGASDDLIAAYKTEIIYTDIISNGQGVTITSPADGATMAEPETYLIGMSDPYYPLSLNGRNISRTKSGYFSLMVDLVPGANTFTFVQNGVEYTHTLYYNISTGSTDGAGTENRTILDTFSVIGAYPSNNITTSDNELWVSCAAPYNSTVTASLNGVEYPLDMVDAPSNKWVSKGFLGVIYGGTIPLPAADDGQILDLGKLTFTASQNGNTASAEGCRVRLLGSGAKIAVTVLEDYTNLKFTENSSYYNDYTVQSAGMTDYIVSQKNGFYQLRMGGYVAEEAVEETEDFPTELTEIGTVSVASVGEQTQIRIDCLDRPAYYGVVEDGRFVLTLYNINADTAPEALIAANPLTDGCEVIRLPESNRVRYSFSLYDERNFYGFDLRYEENETVVTLRNPKKIDLSAETPLSGIRIVLDAGHGGWDGGAAGAMSGFSEKAVNLAVTLEAEKMLSALGADVTLTRSDDSTVELLDRVALLEELEPDLCVSIHQNSMNYSTDITRVRGTLSLYCMDSGLLLAQCVGNAAAEALNRYNRGASYQMLAMCRNPKFPAALIEVGFMTSVEEYEQMANGKGITKAAEGIVNGILDYFKMQSDFADGKI